MLNLIAFELFILGLVLNVGAFIEHEIFIVLLDCILCT